MSNSGKASGQTTPLVATAAAGVALVNGTPVIVTFTTPNDGKLHAYAATYLKVVTVLEVGGAIQLQWTALAQALTATLDAGGNGAGSFPASRVVVADPNTVIRIVQQTALTGGASSSIAAISGG